MNEMMEKFIKYAKEQFGYDISFKNSSTPDTFEKLFGASFLCPDDSYLIQTEKMGLDFSYSMNVAKVNKADFIGGEDFDVLADMTFAA